MWNRGKRNTTHMQLLLVQDLTNHGEHVMQVLEGSFGADSASVPRDSIWVRLPSPYRLTVTQ